MPELGSVRRSQLITTYGVGSIVAIDSNSGMIAGIHRWRADSGTEVFEPRLQKLLNVSRFVAPPAKMSEVGVGRFRRTRDRNIPVVRFPTIHWCPHCLKLDRYDALADDSGKCVSCGYVPVPSRFLICCEDGHIDDFPYMEWVHRGPAPGGRHELSAHTVGLSASLADFEIECSCGAKRTMEGAFSPGAFLDWFWCTGRQPWLGGERARCKKIPRTVQRGASNIYFPVTASAISIPPWSDSIKEIINRHWSMILAIPEDTLPEVIRGMGICDGTTYTPEQVAELILERRQGLEGGPVVTEDDLRRQEYEALITGRAEVSKDQDFVCIPAGGGAEIEHICDKVMAVTRLREVRALTGFTRLRPAEPGETDRIAKLSYHGDEGWLPAAEVLGEGVFFQLREDLIANWIEANPLVSERAAAIDDNYKRRSRSMGIVPSMVITPKFLLLHTLAHMLIDQWALDSGYPAGALRERLYCSEGKGGTQEPMAGILIYTAASDSAGSLGGVVSQAARGKLSAALEGLYRNARWCSSDPLCIESAAGGVDGLNLAACHACCLLPETSCEHQNLFLDRALLVGTETAPEIGFLRMVFES